jgi:hypothetical protein
MLGGLTAPPGICISSCMTVEDLTDFEDRRLLLNQADST